MKNERISRHECQTLGKVRMSTHKRSKNTSIRTSSILQTSFSKNQIFTKRQIFDPTEFSKHKRKNFETKFTLIYVENKKKEDEKR